jgi:formylglycine-generating enzyme required for sulfatase activity
MADERLRQALPAATEAEWERAARAGREGALYVWGDEPPHEHRDYVSRWGGEIKATLPVGGGKPNEWGFYELGENVHEWCADWFEPRLLRHITGAQSAGAQWRSEARHAGFWRHHIKVSRCAARSSIPPHFQYADYGFRVARDGS